MESVGQNENNDWNTVRRKTNSHANATNNTRSKTGPISGKEDQEISFLPPLFLYNRACPLRVTNLDICQSAARLLGYNGVLAAQRFGPLWHLFPKTLRDRAVLAGKILNIEGKDVELFSKNPSELVDDFGNAIPSTKVMIDKAPLKVTNKAIKDALLNLGIKPRSGMNYDGIWSKNGKITPWFSGRRYIFIDIPPTPLPEEIVVDSHKLSVRHKEQNMESQGGSATQRGSSEPDPQGPRQGSTKEVGIQHSPQEGEMVIKGKCVSQGTNTTNTLKTNASDKNTQTSEICSNPPILIGKTKDPSNSQTSSFIDSKTTAENENISDQQNPQNNEPVEMIIRKEDSSIEEGELIDFPINNTVLNINPNQIDSSSADIKSQNETIDKDNTAHIANTVSEQIGAIRETSESSLEDGEISNDILSISHPPQDNEAIPQPGNEGANSREKEGASVEVTEKAEVEEPKKHHPVLSTLSVY